MSENGDAETKGAAANAKPTAGGGKKKKPFKDAKTVALNELLDHLPTNLGKWCEVVESTHTQERLVVEEVVKKRSELPDAPRVAREAEQRPVRTVDLSRIPENGPYEAYVGNLAYKMNKDQVYEVFADQTVINLQLFTDRQTDLFRGSARVEFQSREDLASALQLHGQVIWGREIKIGVNEEGRVRSGPGQQHQYQNTYQNRPNQQVANRNTYYQQATDRGQQNHYYNQSGNESYADSNRYRQDSYGHPPPPDPEHRPGYIRPGTYAPAAYPAEYTENKQRYANNYQQQQQYGRSAHYGNYGPPSRQYYEGNTAGIYDRNTGNRGYGGYSGANQQAYGNTKYEDRHNNVMRQSQGAYGASRNYGNEQQRGPYRQQMQHPIDYQQSQQQQQMALQSQQDYGQTALANHNGTTEMGVRRRTDSVVSETSQTGGTEQQLQRKKLDLKPRTKPLQEEREEEDLARNAAIFGAARPVDTASKEREVEQRLQREKDEFHKKIEEAKTKENTHTTAITTENGPPRSGRTISQSSDTTEAPRLAPQKPKQQDMAEQPQRRQTFDEAMEVENRDEPIRIMRRQPSECSTDTLASGRQYGPRQRGTTRTFVRGRGRSYIQQRTDGREQRHQQRNTGYNRSEFEHEDYMARNNTAGTGRRGRRPHGGTYQSRVEDRAPRFQRQQSGGNKKAAQQVHRDGWVTPGTGRGMTKASSVEPPANVRRQSFENKPHQSSSTDVSTSQKRRSSQPKEMPTLPNEPPPSFSGPNQFALLGEVNE